MIAIYLSGTGNTRYCTEKLIRLLGADAAAIPMEQKNAAELLSREDFIVFAYPVMYSNVPVMARDFITEHGSLWHGKRVLCLATMGLFSGDGAGCAARLLKRFGAEIAGGMHIKMPDSISDVKLLKRTPEKEREIIAAADRKLARCAERIKRGKFPKDGVRFYHRIAGLLGQRLWFGGKTRGYSDELKVSETCVGCGKCARLCPMENITITDGKAVPRGRCTMCYRCINSCPEKALTLLGDEVVRQYRLEDRG